MSQPIEAIPEEPRVEIRQFARNGANSYGSTPGGVSGAAPISHSSIMPDMNGTVNSTNVESIGGGGGSGTDKAPLIGSQS